MMSFFFYTNTYNTIHVFDIFRKYRMEISLQLVKICGCVDVLFAFG